IAALETEQATQNTAITNNETAIADHITADEDTDATNEIQTVASSDSSVNVTTDANNNINLSVTPFDDTAIQTQITENADDIDALETEQTTQNTAIAGNTTNITTNTTDIAALETEQATQNTAITNNETAIADHITADEDTDATNEIQTVASSDSSVNVTTDANNNINLSVTPFDDTAIQTQITENADDIDALETEQATQNTTITNNETAIADHITADEDTDATNEIQTVASSDSSVNVTTDANNNINLSVTPFDDTAIQTQITENADDIDALETEQATQNTAITNNETAIADHITADEDTDASNEVNTAFASDGTNLSITDSNGTLNIPLTHIDSEVTPVVTTGNTIATHLSASGTSTNITETVTTFKQDDTTTASNPAATGEITYKDEKGVEHKAQVVASETGNQLEVGTNGGAYLGPTVYTGTFIISAEGTTTISGIPFQPSQVTFVANANVESLNIDSDNGTGDNDRGINNSHGTMNGFVRNIGGTLAQQVMYTGGHGNSINDISRYASSSNCIGVRYGDQNGSSLGKIEGAFDAFTTDGFTISVNYTNGTITSNSTNPLADVQPTDINNEALLVIFTAYK
uniref:hypothetical protein n=1 Tax=Lacinutrix algicola TaxID=342954 RepID=UPI000AF44684